MKVLFSNPPWWESQEQVKGTVRWRQGVRAGSRWPFTYLGRSAPDQFQYGDYLPYPFFMGYAASYVRKAVGGDVTLRDSIALRESYASYYEHVREAQYDFIFLESATPSWEHDERVIQEIHRVSPRTRIAVAGPITSIRSKHILEQLPVVACLQGEYEKGSVKVVEGATGLLPHNLLTKEEMNAAPFPDFDFVGALNYYDCNPRGQKQPQAQIWSSRGCPYKCIFCVWPATMTGDDPDGTQVRTVRHYTPEYMRAFLTEIQAKHNFGTFYFDDDTFNLGNAHVVKMCEVLAPMGIPWSAMCRADTIKRETWKLMKDSGCFGVKIGFESGSQRVLDEIVNKKLDLQAAREVVLHLKEIGMTVHGTFTYGLPGETHEERMETKSYIASLPFDSIQESGTAEIEGTPLHSLRQTGKLAKYSGAQLAADYVVNLDGNKKMDLLAGELVGPDAGASKL